MSIMKNLTWYVVIDDLKKVTDSQSTPVRSAFCVRPSTTQPIKIRKSAITSVV